MKRLVFFILVLTAFSAQAQTFHEDIAPIIYNNCTECHRIGEIGPMQFTTYEEVSAQGSFIEYVIQSGQMPPWTPDHNYTSFVGERYLSEDDIQLFSDWVAAGMPEGEPSANPGLPNFPEGSQIGEPDLVLQMPEPYVHVGDGTEQYQVFVLPSGLTEEKEISAVEIRPDNSNIAHHGLIGYTANTGAISQAIALDEASEEPGYENFGSYGVIVDDDLFGGWAPGIEALVFPPTIGKKMAADSYLLLQMHYGETLVDESDQTSVNIFFAEEEVEREVESALMSPLHLDEAFYIPANQEVSFHGTMYVPGDVSVLSIIPHSHLLGKSWEVYATSGDNQDTIPMIYIPDWDFHWQGIFTYPSLLHIPEGYTIHAIAEYDNTSANPYNPNNPPQPMTFGDFTTDEMYVVFFQYVNYLPGDENISMVGIDENTFVYNENKLLPAWPNPAPSNSSITVGFHIPTDGIEVNVDLYDVNGRLVENLVSDYYADGFHHIEWNASNQSSGVYFVKINANNDIATQKIVLVK